MNEEIKQKWIDALRSGEYKQTTGGLKNADGFCCLGVLCDIQGTKWRKEKGTNRYFPVLSTIPVDRLMPKKFNIGLDKKTEAFLANMNDFNKSFSEIADYIKMKH